VGRQIAADSANTCPAVLTILNSTLIVEDQTPAHLAETCKGCAFFNEARIHRHECRAMFCNELDPRNGALGDVPLLTPAMVPTNWGLGSIGKH